MSVLHLIRFIGPRATNDPSYTPKTPAVIFRLGAAATATLAVAACATTPIDQAALRHNAERNCRVQLSVSPEVPVGPFGAYTPAERMRRCMASRGFRG